MFPSFRDLLRDLRARRFRNAEGAQDPFRVLYVLGHPKWENLGLQRARFTKN